MKYTRAELECWDRAELIDAVQTLESELNESWISVDAELPDREAGFVLIYINFHEPHTQPATRFGYYGFYDECWRTPYQRLREGWEVTHWMRLPDPPNG